MIIIAAVHFKWRLVSADVSEAFLRGMTFKELFDEGHDKELRKVQLSLPPGAVELLRTLPGMEGFSEETEDLYLRKPGFRTEGCAETLGQSLDFVPYRS